MWGAGGDSHHRRNLRGAAQELHPPVQGAGGGGQGAVCPQRWVGLGRLARRCVLWFGATPTRDQFPYMRKSVYHFPMVSLGSSKGAAVVHPLLSPPQPTSPRCPQAPARHRPVSRSKTWWRPSTGPAPPWPTTSSPMCTHQTTRTTRRRATRRRVRRQAFLKSLVSSFCVCVLLPLALLLLTSASAHTALPWL